MRKKIAILGSTGSIGKSLIDIINKDKKNFEILLLTANKNYIELLKQAKLFNVKNLIITNEKSFKILSKINKDKKIKIYNNFNIYNKIFKRKIDYAMSSISGLEGLSPTLEIIKYTKKIAVANKEALICGWPIIKKELKKNKTQFIPVDSEHFSIWYALKNNKTDNIENIYLTASGGPFNKVPINKIKNIKLSQALKHPNWKMGKKISIDSATMMNKVFEIIEAKNIFDISYNKLSILIHPKSYVHAIIKFNDGLSKIILHDTTMKIPIFNSLYSNYEKIYYSKVLDIQKLNNLDLCEVNLKRFPLVKILQELPIKSSLFETIVVAANDELVDLYLKKKIKFTDIQNRLLKFLMLKEFDKFKKIRPRNIESIYKLNRYVRLKINPLSV